MVISVRDKDNNLRIKDILDFDFDMSVEKCSSEKGKPIYKVQINSKYYLDGTFDDKSSAEEKMIAVANARNELENELRNF